MRASARAGMIAAPRVRTLGRPKRRAPEITSARAAHEDVLFLEQLLLDLAQAALTGSRARKDRIVARTPKVLLARHTAKCYRTAYALTGSHPRSRRATISACAALLQLHTLPADVSGWLIREVAIAAIGEREGSGARAQQERTWRLQQIAGLSTLEIAVALDIQDATARSRLHRGLKWLRPQHRAQAREEHSKLTIIVLQVLPELTEQVLELAASNVDVSVVGSLKPNAGRGERGLVQRSKRPGRKGRKN